MNTLHDIPKEFEGVPFVFTDRVRNRIGDLCEIGYRIFLFYRTEAHPNNWRMRVSMGELWTSGGDAYQNDNSFRSFYVPDECNFRITYETGVSNDNAGEIYDRARRVYDPGT